MAKILIIHKKTGKSSLAELSPQEVQDTLNSSYADEADLFDADSGEPVVKEGLPFGKEDAPGVIDSFARGAAQGATFGFADELANPLDKNERRISRENYDRAREANPGFYIAGDIAGGLVPGAIASVASGGAAGPAAAANATSKLAKVGQLLNTTKGSAALGAAQGALRAQGDSKDGWANQNDLAAQTAIGGGVGAVAPALVRGAGSLFSGPIKKLKDWAAPLLGKTDDAANAAVDAMALKANAEAARIAAETEEMAKIGQNTIPKQLDMDFTPDTTTVTGAGYSLLKNAVDAAANSLTPAERKILSQLPSAAADLKTSPQLNKAYETLKQLSLQIDAETQKQAAKQAGIKAAQKTVTTAQETMAQKQAALANKAAAEEAKKAAAVGGVAKSAGRASVPAVQAVVNPPVLQNIFDSNFKSWLKSTGRDYEKLSPEAKELLEKKSLSKKDKTALYEELLNDPQMTEDEKTELMAAYSDNLMEKNG